jgi:predicted ATPase
VWLLGDAEGGERELLEAEALVAELRHAPSTAFFLSFGAYIAFYRRDYVQARSVATRMLALAEREGYLLWIGVAKIYHGWALAGLGEVEAGVRETEEGHDLFRKTGSALTLVHILVARGETLRIAGRGSEALALLDEGFAHARENAEHLLEPELYRLRAELLLEQPQPDRRFAAQSLDEGLKLAREQGARALERHLNAVAGLLEPSRAAFDHIAHEPA